MRWRPPPQPGHVIRSIGRAAAQISRPRRALRSPRPARHSDFITAQQDGEAIAKPSKAIKARLTSAKNV